MAKLIPLALRSEPKSSKTSEDPEDTDVANNVPMSVVFFDVDQLFGDGNHAGGSEVTAAEPATTSNSAALVEANNSSLASPSTGSGNTFSTVVDGKEITLSLNNADCVRELVCPENGARVFVIGTAHFSEQSQKDVTALISRLTPDCVVLELCAARAAILELDEAVLLNEASSRMTVDRFRMLVRKHGGNTTRAVLECLLLNLSAHVAKELGMAPGGEFRAAARAAHELNRTHSEQPATDDSADRQVRRCRVLLGDRPISVTLQRAFATLSAWHKLKLFFTLIASSFESITREQVEAFKNRDMLVEALRQLAGSQPQFSAVLVDERDAYLATSLRVAALDIPELERAQRRDANRPPQQPQPEAQTNSDTTAAAGGSSGADAEPTASNDYNAALRRAVRRPPLVVGVVGLGHVDGIVRYWNAHERSGEMLRAIRPLMIVPRRNSRFAPAAAFTIKWTVRVALLAAAARLAVAAYSRFSGIRGD